MVALVNDDLSCLDAPLDNPGGFWQALSKIRREGLPPNVSFGDLAERINLGLVSAWVKQQPDLKPWIDSEVKGEMPHSIQGMLDLFNVGLFFHRQGTITTDEFGLAWLEEYDSDKHQNNRDKDTWWAATVVTGFVSELLLEDYWSRNTEYPGASRVLFDSFMQTDYSELGLSTVWHEMLWGSSEGDGTMVEHLARFILFLENSLDVLPSYRVLGRDDENQFFSLKVSRFEQRPILLVHENSAYFTAYPHLEAELVRRVEEFYRARYEQEEPAAQMVSRIDPWVFRQRLQAMWNDLKVARRGLLPFGNDSVSISVPELLQSGFSDLHFWPLQAPDTTVIAKRRLIGIHGLLHLETEVKIDIQEEAIQELMSRSDVNPVDLLIYISVHSQWLMLVSEKQQKNTEHQLSQLLVKVPMDQLRRIVRPMFKKLAPGAKRTIRAEDRSKESGKGLPPEGMTFARTDFDPVTQEPIPSRRFRYVKKGRQQEVPKQPKIIQPRFVYTTELLGF